MPLDPSLLASVAASIGVSPHALSAVVAVESAGSGLDKRGRPLIRVEAHLLWRHTSGAARAAVDARFKVLGPRAWEGHRFDGASYHGSPAREWMAFGTAFAIDSDAAVRATSWGLGQVLGEWRWLGYASEQAFVVAQADVAGQLDTMARFIRARGLVDELRRLDWSGFALGYNGSGNVPVYAAKLAQAYERAAE